MEATLLITGLGGFIGSHLARGLLDEGFRVVGVDNFDPFYDRSLKQDTLADLSACGVECHDLDVRDMPSFCALIEKTCPIGIMHMAGRPGISSSIDDPAGSIGMNLDALWSILEAARITGVHSLCIASSSSVYGRGTSHMQSEDDAPACPLCPYAAAKRGGEDLCHAWAAAFGLRIAILRYFTVYGPRQRPDMAIGRFMRMIDAGQEVTIYGDGTSHRDYTFAADTVAGTLAARQYLEGTEAGFFRRWNIGSGAPVMLGDLVEAIAEVVGRRPILEYQPSRDCDAVFTWADLERAGGELGYAPAICLEDGLRQQWEWLRGTGSVQRCGATNSGTLGSVSAD